MLRDEIAQKLDDFVNPNKNIFDMDDDEANPTNYIIRSLVIDKYKLGDNTPHIINYINSLIKKYNNEKTNDFIEPINN